MELLLNLCWLGISIWAFGAWRANSAERKRAGDSTRTCTEAVALACALILLFFPISITDDLHPEIFLAADCLSHRKNSPIVCAGKTGVHQPTLCGISPFANLRVGRTALPTPFFTGLVEVHTPPLESFSADAARGRAPPVSLA